MRHWVHLWKLQTLTANFKKWLTESSCQSQLDTTCVLITRSLALKVGKTVISYKSIYSRNFICQNGHISLTVGWQNVMFGGMEERGSQIYVKKFSSDMFSAKSFSTPPQNLWLFFFTQGHKVELVKLHNPSLLIKYRYILRPSCQEPSPVYRNSKSVLGRPDRENPNEMCDENLRTQTCYYFLLNL